MSVNNTEARRRASRENGRKSRGPVTEEGKSQASRNALKHGLTARVLVAPEDEAAFRERAEVWAEAAQPADSMEAWLVERAAWNSVRLDRCARREMSVIADRRQKAASDWDLRQQEDVDGWGRLFASDPADAVAGLERSALGCDHMVRIWRILEAQAECHGDWTAGEELTALRLLGHQPTEPRGPAPQPGSVVAELIQILHTTRAAFASDGQALARFARSEADRLERRRDLLRTERDAPDRALAINLSLFDDSESAALQRRYETACSSDLHRALADLARLRQSRTSGGSESDEPPSPRAPLPLPADPADVPEPTHDPVAVRPEIPLASVSDALRRNEPDVPQNLSHQDVESESSGLLSASTALNSKPGVPPAAPTSQAVSASPEGANSRRASRKQRRMERLRRSQGLPVINEIRLSSGPVHAGRPLGNTPPSTGGAL